MKKNLTQVLVCGLLMFGGLYLHDPTLVQVGLGGLGSSQDGSNK